MRSLPQTLRIWVISEQCPVLMKNVLKVVKEGVKEGLGYEPVAMIVILVSHIESFCD